MSAEFQKVLKSYPTLGDGTANPRVLAESARATDVINRTQPAPKYLHLSAAPVPDSTILAGSTVALRSDRAGTIIYYTLDGTEPDASSSLYGGPITISNSRTLRALGIADGFVDGTLSAAYAVGSAPTISQQPQGDTVDAGDSVLFTVTASGSSPLTYQWRKNGAAIDGATASSLTIPRAAEDDEGAYSCVVTNAFGSITSSTVGLVVNPIVFAPNGLYIAIMAGGVLTSPAPSSYALPSGVSVVLSSGTGGTAPFAYQWYKNGAAISGQTGAGTTVNSAGVYRFTAANSAGSATSPIITVADEVIATSGAILHLTVGGVTTEPSSYTIPIGASPVLGVDVRGSSPITIQWYKNGAAISGQAGTTYSLSTAGVYHYVATNSAGSATSPTITVSAALATATFSPASGASVPASGSLAVTITPGVVGAALEYTLDGSDVTAVGNTSIRTASAAVSVTVPAGQAASYQARTVAGGSSSAVASASYEPAGQLATPVFTPSSGATLPVTVSAVGPADSNVWYTTDVGVQPAAQGVTPSSPWLRYASPIALSTPTMLRAQGRDHAVKSNSQLITAMYGLAEGQVALGFVRRNADRVGNWGTFVGTGAHDSLQFNFFANFAAPVTVHAVCFVDKVAQAGAIWSSWRYPTDAGLAGATGGAGSPAWTPNGSGVYPAVVDFAGAQLRNQYVSPAAGLTVGGVLLAPTNDDFFSPRGNLGNYSGLVAFSVFVSATSWSFQPGQIKIMKVVLYASPVGSNVVTRYWSECPVPA